MSLMTITTGLSLLPYLLFHTTPNNFCLGLQQALALEQHLLGGQSGDDQHLDTAHQDQLQHQDQHQDQQQHPAHEAGLGQSGRFLPSFRLDSRSVGVTGEGLYFPINSSLGLFVGIALVLALHSFILVYMSITRSERLKRAGKGEDYHVYLLEHQFTSPDAPVTAQDDIIPQR